MNEPKDYEYLLLCDGSTISEENYPELVAVLGGTQLPNLIDRFLQGAVTAGMYKEAGLPNITGETGNFTFISRIDKGAFYATSGPNNGFGASTNHSEYLKFDASKSNSIYGNSTTVQPPAYTAKIYICYAG